MSLGGQVRDTADDGTDRARFVTVMRGYDRIEVDEYVRHTHRSVQRLRTELAESEGRRRRAEQHAEAVDKEVRAARAQLGARPSAPAEEGFGVRAERLLRIARISFSTDSACCSARRRRPSLSASSVRSR